MSIAANAVSELAIAEDSATTTSTPKPPRRRKVTARADAVLQPEAR